MKVARLKDEILYASIYMIPWKQHDQFRGQKLLEVSDGARPGPQTGST